MEQLKNKSKSPVKPTEELETVVETKREGIVSPARQESGLINITADLDKVQEAVRAITLHEIPEEGKKQQDKPVEEDLVDLDAELLGN